MTFRACRGRIGQFILPLLIASMFPGTVAGLQATPEAPPVGTSARVGPFQFDTGPYELIDLPIELLPYYGPTVVSSCGLTDGSGVAMFQTGGVIYNHPVAQSRCALNMLRNYRLTSDPAYLDTAIANANRLLNRGVAHGGGLFFPYPFNWNNPGRGSMTAPWYYVGASRWIRVPGGISQYCSSDACLAAKVRNPAYHITHIGQLTKLFHMTAHWHFASLAEAFIGDSPRTDAGRAS